jgi:tRNA A-37 threonylcarbamoyl transferase component Bud32/tetratricopeptide (TPR) repeat protein
MGEVYAAYDPDLDRKIALKVLLADALVDDRLAQERLLREAQAIAKLSHPNVVVVHDVGTFRGKGFVAMEFVEGATLAAWLREAPRSWREIVDAFVAAARGLAAAHRAGIVHRDFKPQNVMITAEGAVRVMDFGLARRLGQAPEERVAGSSVPADAITRTGDQVGTPLFMAPEQYAGGDVDARADLFSFCVALFWALFGEHPFGSRPSTPSASAARAAAGVPPWLREVITRGLHTNPADRWPSMDALIVALGRDPARTRRRVAAVAAGVVACLAAGALVSHAVEGAHVSCDGGPARLAGVWESGDAGRRDGSRREAVRKAILTGAPVEGPRIWARFADLLDRHTAKWASEYRSACEATEVRHEQSAELFDLRIECLTDALDATRAVTGLVATGGASVVEHAIDAASDLGDFNECSDTTALHARVRLPMDPKVRARAQALRARLHDAAARAQAVDIAGARPMIADALAEARALHLCPLEAEAMLLQGDVEARLKDIHAIETFQSVVLTAERCGHDRALAEAAVGLVGLCGNQATAPQNLTLARHYADLARATLERIGGDARLETWLANNVGDMHVTMGELQLGKQDFERAIALKTKRLGPDHIDVAISKGNVGYVLSLLGEYEAAVAVDDEVSLAVRRWGDAAPVMAVIAQNRGEALLKLGRLDEAEAELQEALRYATNRGQNSAFSADMARGGLGAVLLARGRAKEAVPYLEIAVRTWGADRSVNSVDVQFALARALDAVTPGDARALTLARDAASKVAGPPDLAPRLREIEAWLAARRPGVAEGAIAATARPRRQARPLKMSLRL